METKKVVNGLSCSFNKNTYLVWGAIICCIASVILSIITLMSFPNYNNPGNLLLGLIILPIVQVVIIITLLYFFQKSCKILGRKVYTQAQTLYIAMIVLTVIEIISAFMEKGMGIIAFGAIVWLIVTTFKLGNRIIKEYNGEINVLGHRFLYLTYVTIASLCITFITLVLCIVNSLNIIPVMIFTQIIIIIMGLIVSIYAYFGVFLKMARILDAEYDGPEIAEEEEEEIEEVEDDAALPAYIEEEIIDEEDEEPLPEEDEKEKDPE